MMDRLHVVPFGGLRFLQDSLLIPLKSRDAELVFCSLILRRVAAGARRRRLAEATALNADPGATLANGFAFVAFDPTRAEARGNNLLAAIREPADGRKSRTGMSSILS